MKATSGIFMALAASFLATTSSPAGSLWSEKTTNEHGMFADKRACRVGDIVTIVVNESTAATNSLDLTTSRTASTGTGNFVTNLINQFITALPGSILGKNRLTQAATKANLPGTSITAPAVDVSGSADYKGGGKINNTQTVSSRAAVTVIDVLPNGNLVVEGVRLVRFSGETQYASLRGVLRPADVQKDNTVLSTNLADAQVEFVSEGTLSEAQKKGWLLRLSNKVNPF